MRKNYAFGDIVEVERGFFAGQKGEIVAYFFMGFDFGFFKIPFAEKYKIRSVEGDTFEVEKKDLPLT